MIALGYSDRERTEGFIYLPDLSPEVYSALFDQLYLPREEWRLRLRIGKRDFTRFVDGGDRGHRLRVYIDPVTRKKCYRGSDIRAALRQCQE